MSIAGTIGALGEVALALSRWVPSAKPSRVADIDATWLTAILATRTPGARVLGVEDRGGSSGTTDRRRLALTWNDTGVAALALGYERASAAVDDLAVDEIVERRVTDGYR